MTTAAALAARVLIVDDDAALLQALPEALRLRMPGVTVDICESAASALDLVAATDYDAIVSDIKMPGMDGLALLPEIRARRPDTPTLLITGHGEHDLAVQALRGGAFDFIQKPIDRDYFVASLSRAVRLRQLSREVDEQRAALERHAAELERTVEARTRELRAANEAQAELLVRERAARAEAEEAQRHLTSLALQLDRTLADAELLNAIAKAAAGEDDFGRILAVALDHLGRVVRFTGGSVALIEGDELVIRAAVGPFAGAALGQRLPRGTGATWRVVETGEPFRCDDVVAAGLRPTTPFRSFLAAPLVWRGCWRSTRPRRGPSPTATWRSSGSWRPP